MPHVNAADDLSRVRIYDANFVTVLTDNIEHMTVWGKRHLDGGQIVLFHKSARLIGSGFRRDGQ
jgi:hypothetical protein